MLLPDKLFGQDIDDLLAYTTTKKVFIRDRWLGIIYYSLIFFVICWVFGYQIIVKNEQFLLKDVQGLPRMWAKHPTLNQCDPQQPDCKSDYRSLEQLSYCDSFKGGVGEGNMRAPCKYEDMHTTGILELVDNKLFVPTSVELVTERRHCKPNAANGHTCDNEYVELPGEDCLQGTALCRKRANKSDQFYYVADTKSFMIQFTSSYEEGNVHGTSLDHPGFYSVCKGLLRDPNVTLTWPERLHYQDDNSCEEGEEDVREIPCGRDIRCHRMGKFDLMEQSGANKLGRKIGEEERKLREKIPLPNIVLQQFPLHRAPGTFVLGAEIGVDRKGAVNGSRSQTAFRKQTPLEQASIAANEKYYPTEEQYQSAWGDFFKLGRLMALAGADLDKDSNFDGWTTRQSGTVIEVRVVYNNLYPVYSAFGYKQVKYHYEVRELPMPYISRTKLADSQPDDYPNTRVYEVRHGILVWFKVSGTFGVFSLIYFLLMLITALALFATAVTVTDAVAIYLHKRKKNYFHLKYEISEDFSGLWKCETCGYLNGAKDQTCQGLQVWECVHTAERCGRTRPES